MKKINIIFSAGILTISLLITVIFTTGIWKIFFYPENHEQVRSRIITLQETKRETAADEPSIWGENSNIGIKTDEGEEILMLFALESEGEYSQEQIALYRRPAEAEGPVYVTCIRYDDINNVFRRIWNDVSAATRTETISVYSQDLIGDRSSCVVITGMNNRNEHTMTIFNRGLKQAAGQPFKKIGEFTIDGSIVIRETGRSLAYQQGITTGASFTIAAYSHDAKSGNILDQLETIYTYNPAAGKYEISAITMIPGSQVEQRRLRELLSGAPGVFENFISDLWYYVSPQGTLDSRQYLYFNPSGREVIFFGDETQQVFYWQNSTPQRYGLYITTQNISISTLRRFIDIELESLDSIRIRVFEDVKLKITVSASWDGSYRRAPHINETGSPVTNVIDAQYDSPWGRIRFMNNGEYLINTGGALKKGRYAFFKANDQKLLELRPEYESAENRLVYSVETGNNNALYITRVKIGTNRIQDLLEGQITFTPVTP
ncbi:MAG: pallilysin-related adhesin [Treponema sp.]|jgi:hypothetical protein|nr:pallilysin-related adhesin [Treponema sp.]